MARLRSDEQGFIERLKPWTDEQFEKGWEFDQSYNLAAISSFSGPTDPRYREYKYEKTRRVLESVRYRIKQLEENKP